MKGFSRGNIGVGGTAVKLACGLRVEISDDCPCSTGLLRELGDVEHVEAIKEMQTVGPDQASLVVFRMPADQSKWRSIPEENEMGSILYDKKYKTLLQVDPEYGVSLACLGPSYEWLFWGLQMALLRGGFTFVHGACVEKDGEAILIAARGGVGKTAIAGYLVHELGYKLLADDLAILDNQGTCYACLKPMTLYPYHKRIFPSAFGAAPHPIAPTWMSSALECVLPKLKAILRLLPSSFLELARRYNPASFQMNPSDVFGADALASQAKLSRILWLERPTECTIHSVVALDHGRLVSQLFAGTLMEFDEHCMKQILLAMRGGTASAAGICGRWLDILSQTVDNVPQLARLRLPADYPIEKIGSIVGDILESE